MSLFSKLYGTVSSFFQIGGTAGPGWLSDSGNLDGYNSTISSYINVRGADPVAAHDFVTLEYGNAHYGGGSVAVTQIEVNFGTIPRRSKTFTITDASVSTSTPLIVMQSGAAAPGRQADENEMDPITFSGTPGSGQFILIASALNGPVVGNYMVNYIVG